MGDNIDCCGADGRTARLDHYMPENMDEVLKKDILSIIHERQNYYEKMLTQNSLYS